MTVGTAVPAHTSMGLNHTVKVNICKNVTVIIINSWCTRTHWYDVL